MDAWTMRILIVCETAVLLVCMLTAAQLYTTEHMTPPWLTLLIGTASGSLATLAVPQQRGAGNGGNGGNSYQLSNVWSPPPAVLQALRQWAAAAAAPGVGSVSQVPEGSKEQPPVNPPGVP